MEHIRYSVVACQTDLPNPIERRQMRANTDRMLSMIDSAVAGSAPFLPVKLIVFRSSRTLRLFETVTELIGNDTDSKQHTERIEQGARARRLHSDRLDAGGRFEWPGRVFNTTCLIGPEGVLTSIAK
jgi:hypothetical protein